jgi:hypothetical protein
MVSVAVLGFTRKTGEGNMLSALSVRCYDCSASVDECVRSIGGTAPTEVLREEPAHCHFVPINLTCTGLGSDPSHRSGRPSTNLPSHGKVFMALNIHIMDLWCVALCGSVGWSQCVLKMEAAVSFELMATVHEGTRPGTREHILANVAI